MSYTNLSYKRLREKVENGATIRWCGHAKNGAVIVQLTKKELSMFYSVDVDNIIETWPSTGVIRNGGAAKPLQDTGFVPTKTDSFVTFRNATILGINTGGKCVPETCAIYEHIEGCVCGYDIELDLKGQPRGRFPSPMVDILSLAIHCSCGYRKFISTLEPINEYCVQVNDQREFARMLIQEVINHRPLWLVGWNNYSFDNTCLMVQYDPAHPQPLYVTDGEHQVDCNSYFRKLKIGIAGTSDYGNILDIPGVYNVDPMLYMQRDPSHARKHNKDFSLYGVAKALDTTQKGEMPDLHTDINPIDLLEYNMADSAIAAEIWVKSGLVNEVPSLALTTCSHIYDASRYMTSVTARCPLSTEALLLGMEIDWSECVSDFKYQGGKVLDPIKGLHDNVVVCDFSSMYPTIMVDSNISPETLIVLPADEHEYGDVWFDDLYVYVRASDSVASFPYRGNGMLKRLLVKFVDLRKKYKKSRPVYATTLKVASNSIYGSLGYSNSPMYNPLCSIATTAIGRWCLTLACTTMEEHTLRVVYGDTDSCMVTKPGATKEQVQELVHLALDDLHHRLKQTPFAGMYMEFENQFARMLFLEKKKYCSLTYSGTMTYKGMSVVRRDVLGICKDACSSITDAVLQSASIREANQKIVSYVCKILYRAINKKLTPGEVSLVKKRNQRRCYVYTDELGEEQTIPVDLGVNVVSNYSVSTVLGSFKKEVHRITAPCGLGSISDIMSRSTDIF